MKRKILIFVITILTFVLNAKSQDTLVSGFFGLDNGLPGGLLAGQPGLWIDGMPVNFRFPLDSSSLSVTDFEVVDSDGNIHIPMNAVLSPANEDGENRTVLLLGEFGTAVTNPPVEVRVVGDLFTIDTLPEESAYSQIINLNGMTTTNIIPLADGPSLFFAQRIDGNLNECNSGTQTIQVAWDGGITPYISGDTESDLFQYYIGYSDSSGVLTPHVPISIADIDDTDNFHQLCFSTSDEIVKISMMANTVKDPNHDPNSYSEIYVSYSYSLSTSSSPSNSGTVSGDGTYNSGSTISISATPSNGYQFSHWSGDASGSSNPLSITINQDTSIVANFSVTDTNNTSETTLEPDPEYAPSSLLWKKLTFGGLSILVMANEQSSAKVKDLNSGDWEKQSYQWDASGTNATLYLDGTPQDKDKVLKLTFTSNAGGSVEWENWDTDTNGQNFLKESGTDTFTIADFTAEELPSTKGWMWFDLYPWVYSHVEGDWLYFLASGSTLMIYSAKDEAWREME
jgi:hypothetical protein